MPFGVPVWGLGHYSVEYGRLQGVYMLTPLSREFYEDSAVRAFEHPACELFPACSKTGRLFGLGVALGFAGLSLDGFGVGVWSWVLLALAGAVLLFAGSRVIRD